jgi:hypothetical protein
MSSRQAESKHIAASKIARLRRRSRIPSHFTQKRREIGRPTVVERFDI